MDEGAGKVPGQRHHCLHKHRNPVDGLRKHDDIPLCVSYFFRYPPLPSAAAARPKNASLTKT